MIADPLGGLEKGTHGPQQEQRIAHPRTPVTLGLLLVLLAFFAVQMAVGPRHDPTDPLTLYRLGALHPPSVAAGDRFRLGSYAFLHIGPAHLAMNAWALWILMRPVEGALGGAVALGLFSASALAGGGASAFHGLRAGLLLTQSAGASGGLFGLFGATAAIWFRLRHRLPPAALRGAVRALLINIALNAAIAFLAPVDSFAHAGGFVAGALLALLAPLPADPKGASRRLARAGLLGCTAILAACEAVAVFRAIHPPERTLEVDGLLAQAPFELPEVAPGEAFSVDGLYARIARSPSPPPQGPVRHLGDHAWVSARSSGGDALSENLLVTADGPGSLAIEVRCYRAGCAERVDPVGDELARSLHIQAAPSARH